MIRAARPISVWNICISGFLQHEGHPTGVVALWRDLHAEHAGADERVELRTWCDNWSALAEFIFRYRTHEGQPTINVFGYSYGAGWGAMQLAKQLRRRGLFVSRMVLSDPVYRHWYPLGQWRLLFSAIPIWVPDNVKHVSWFRQSNSFPWGHDLKADNPKLTRVETPITLTLSHVYMDDAQPFHELCRKVARGAA